jgi:hypothetical protein
MMTIVSAFQFLNFRIDRNFCEMAEKLIFCCSKLRRKRNKRKVSQLKAELFAILSVFFSGKSFFFTKK